MAIDQFENKQVKELEEKDFIQEPKNGGPLPLMMMALILGFVVAIFWGVSSYYFQTLENQLEENPFLQVTNRQMSVFLWQFPENMPQHVKEKTGYLPGFEYRERIGLKMESVDDYVQAPPELLFLYHTWDRLLSKEFISRSITREEFVQFLLAQPEWKPENWIDAPKGYRSVVEGLRFSKVDEMETLPLEDFPLIVRQAFQGWKNYRFEGDYINLLNIRYQDLKEFLVKYPHYSRNYWRNVVGNRYPAYLMSYTFGEFSLESEVPRDEIAPFLRVAIYNYFQKRKGF